MVALRRSSPFEVLPATPLSLLGATPLVPSENTLSPDRNGADLALAEGLDASAAERVFGYRQATITTWLTRAGEYAQTLHERSHLAISGSRTSSWTNCAPGCAAPHTCSGSGWPSIPSRAILPALHLGPRTQNAAHIVIHSLRQLLDAFLPPTLHQ